MPRQTTTPTPRSVGVNLTELREQATREMLESIRAFVKRMDELDILDRVLNQQAGTLAKAAPANGNGHHPVAENPMADNTAARRHHPDRHAQPTRAESQQLYQEVLDAIANAKGPATVTEIATALGRSKNTINYRLIELQRRGQIVATKIPSPSPYGGPPLNAYRLASAEPAQGFDKARTVRQMVAFVLRKKGSAAPPEITEYLVAQGVPVKRGTSVLNNHVNWALRDMLKRKLLTRSDATGRPVYTPTKRMTDDGL